METNYNYGTCQACGEPMVYDRQGDERPHGNDEWHPECCPECVDMSRAEQANARGWES